MTGAAYATPSATASGAGRAAVVDTNDSQPPAETPSIAKYECSDSHHSDTGNGANNDDGYQSTCDPDDFGGNGQEHGPGLQTGKPCAGCVGNADDKNPPGQFPDGSDLNSGYECDGRDRPSKNQEGNGNHGIGDENPAHTGCDPDPIVPPAPTCPDGTAMPTTDVNVDGLVDVKDCEKEVRPPVCPGENTLPLADRDGNDIIDERDCTKVVVVETCPDGSDMPTKDVDGNGVVNAADCNKPVDVVVEKTCPDGSPMKDGNNDGVVDERDCTKVVVVETCPDGSDMPTKDVDGNGVVNAADCNTPKDVVEVENKVDTTPVALVVDTTPPVLETLTVTPAVEAIEIPTTVLGLTVEQAEVAPEAVLRPLRETTVLGAQITRNAPALAVTGAGGVDSQAALALTLLALGLALVLVGRRPQAS